MADTRKPPESPGGGPRRKRVAPTIDLTATEVPHPSADNPEAATPEPPIEPAPAAEAPPAEPAPQPATAAPEPPAEEEMSPEPERAAPPPPSPPPPPRGGIGAGVAGGVIGAVIVAALAAGLWYGGYMPSSPIQPNDLPARIAALEKQVDALQNRPLPKLDTSALDKSVGALSQRVSKVESELSNLPPSDKAAAQRLTGLDSTVQSLSIAVSAINKRGDDIAAAAKQAQQSAAAAEKVLNDLKQRVQNAAKGATTSVAPGALDALQKKVAEIETELANARSKIEGEIKTVRGDVTSAQDRIAKAAASDRATRLALSATALRNAVVSGAPYAAELAQAKSLSADAKTLAPLDRFAQSGLPTKNQLANELVKLIPTMRKAAGAKKTSSSFLERLQANANKLVRITPVEGPAGNDVSDVLARIEAEAAHADITNALADLAKLPDNVRAPANDWIAKAKARQDALAAARSFSASATRALGKG
jgi:hypothetical protein